MKENMKFYVLTSLWCERDVMIKELSKLHGHMGEPFPADLDHESMWVILISILSCSAFVCFPLSCALHPIPSVD